MIAVTITIFNESDNCRHSLDGSEECDVVTVGYLLYFVFQQASCCVHISWKVLVGESALAVIVCVVQVSNVTNEAIQPSWMIKWLDIYISQLKILSPGIIDMSFAIIYFQHCRKLFWTENLIAICQWTFVLSWLKNISSCFETCNTWKMISPNSAVSKCT